MSDLTIAPTRPPTSARRARVLSEAVVSSYLREIMPPRTRPSTVAVAVPAAPLAPPAVAPGPAAEPVPVPAVGPVSAPVPASLRPRVRSRGSRRRSPLQVGTRAAVQAMRRP